jgi:hypothetical protein
MKVLWPQLTESLIAHAVPAANSPSVNNLPFSNQKIIIIIIIIEKRENKRQTGGRKAIQWRLTENDICSSAQSSRKLHHLLPIDEYHSDKSSSATLSLSQRWTANGPSWRPGRQPLGAANSSGRSPATKLSRECGQNNVPRRLSVPGVGTELHWHDVFLTAIV